MFGLKLDTIQAIQHVFAQHSALKRALLYGSRAKGNYRTGSDIDLALEGDGLDLGILHKIENELDDLMLPYKMDVALLRQIQNADLLDHIGRVGVVFYEKDH